MPFSPIGRGRFFAYAAPLAVYEPVARYPVAEALCRGFGGRGA